MSTFKELLAEGLQKVAEQRKKLEEAAAERKAKDEACEIEAGLALWEGVDSVIPQALRPFVRRARDGSLYGEYQIGMILEAPRCAPIRFVMIDREPWQLNGNQPFVIPVVSEDWEAKDHPRFEFNGHVTETGDLSVALALAAERNEQYQEALDAWHNRPADTPTTLEILNTPPVELPPAPQMPPTWGETMRGKIKDVVVGADGDIAASLCIIAEVLVEMTERNTGCY